jgi:hypothetical protein
VLRKPTFGPPLKSTKVLVLMPMSGRVETLWNEVVLNLFVRTDPFETTRINVIFCEFLAYLADLERKKFIRS